MSSCIDPFIPCRRPTVEVMVGGVGIGGLNPVRMQSMTTTKGRDVEGSVRQTIELVAAGAELVRITTPTVADAMAMGEVRRALEEQGIAIPLVADIHFSPPAALEAARWVDKVRINPGNYCSTRETSSEEEYQAALVDMRARLAPLIAICRQRGVAIRIGVNHGSLAPRVVARYGAGPEGMVQSALEVVDICRQLEFHSIVISLKSSVPRAMVLANRLLAQRLDERGWNYPLHLGVTEAGEGEDGRVKSAIGIGALLVDGIGDTIRVSLTEPAVNEIPVCRYLVETTAKWREEARGEAECRPKDLPSGWTNTARGRLRKSKVAILQCSGLVVVDIAEARVDTALLQALGYVQDNEGRWQARPQSADLVLCAPSTDRSTVPQELRERFLLPEGENCYCPMLGAWRAKRIAVEDVLANPAMLSSWLADVQLAILTAQHPGIHSLRAALYHCTTSEISIPIVLEQRVLNSEPSAHYPEACGLAYGPLLLDGLAEGVVLQGGGEKLSIALSVLQTCEMRRVKADLVACPGCGRTLFELQATLAKVRAATGHLKHLKIGVMGCIVNGPGEMMDADYGYVGSGPGRVTLYKGQRVVARNVPEGEAIERLVDLIRDEGDWEERG